MYIQIPDPPFNELSWTASPRIPKGLIIQATDIKQATTANARASYQEVCRYERTIVRQVIVKRRGSGPFIFAVGKGAMGVQLFERGGSEWVVAISDGTRWANIILPEFDPEWILDVLDFDPESAGPNLVIS